MSLFKRDVKVRYKPQYAAEIIVQRENHAWLWWSFILPPITLPLMFFWRYEDWQLIDEDQYKIEQELLKTTDKLKRLLLDHAAAVKKLSRDKEVLEDQMKQTRGNPEPFTIKDRLFFKKTKFMKRPSNEWRDVINPQLLNNRRDYMRQQARERSKAPMDNSEQPRQASMTLGKFKPYGESLGETNDNMSYYDPKKDSKGGGNHWQNRRKGESKEEHKSRVSRGPDSEY